MRASARELRWICKHDSFTVEGCVTCSAADEIDRLRAELEKAESALIRNYRDARDESDRLRAENEALQRHLDGMSGFADLWYFVMDEAPLQFEKIVAEYSPASWMQEAAKLRAGMRGQK